MIPTNRIPEHPGEILLEEFLRPLHMSQVAFAKHLAIPLQRVNEIVNGKRGITPETAWKFGKAFGTTPEFWMNLQASYDLAMARESASGVKPLRKVG
jgi:addiction module HigA family antidote